MGKSVRTIIMKLTKWLKRQAIYLALAMVRVEKTAFSQKTNELNSTVGQERRHSQGTLMDSLQHGEVTQEVMNLRWRTYKILKATEGLKTEIIGYDENNMPITQTKKTDKKKGLSKVKIDSVDKYTLNMVVDNSPIFTSSNDAMGNENISVFDEVKLNYNDMGEIISATHGDITGDQYFATHKPELPIKITRDITPKFELETYTKKLHVRNIDKKNRLLEFYVSKYPDEYDRRTRLFISDIKKTIENPRSSTILEIKDVSFITYKTIGEDDFKEYQYKILSFDKIIDFNGHYVVKFIAEVIIDGKDILDEYKIEELDEKYNNKVKKKQ